MVISYKVINLALQLKCTKNSCMTKECNYLEEQYEEFFLGTSPESSPWTFL